MLGLFATFTYLTSTRGYVNVLLAADEIEGWELNSQGRFWFGDIVMLDLESN